MIQKASFCIHSHRLLYKVGGDKYFRQYLIHCRRGTSCCQSLYRFVWVILVIIDPNLLFIHLLITVRTRK